MKVEILDASRKIYTDIWKLGSLRRHLADTLYKNFIYIGSSRIINKAVGLVFWTVAARFYSMADVGIATALISSLELIVTFSRLGFDISIIRFMPIRNKDQVFSSCLWIPLISSIIVALFFYELMDFISPSFIVLKGHLPIFLITVMIYSLLQSTGYALLALRMGQAYLYQNLLQIVRIPLLPPFAPFGALGIFGTLCIAYLVALTKSVSQLRRYVSFRPSISIDFTKETFRFSFMNFLSNLLNLVPPLIMPLMVLNVEGPEKAAMYYVAFALGNIVLIVPDALSTSFFVEGSHGKDLKSSFLKTFVTIYVILLPLVVVTCVFGEFMLGLIGKSYLAAFDLFKVIAISSIFIAVYHIYIPVQNVSGKVSKIVALNVVKFLLLIPLSYLGLLKFGIMGLGYAWIGTYAALSMIVAYDLRDFLSSKLKS